MNPSSSEAAKAIEAQVRDSFSGLSSEALSQMTVSQFLGQALNILFESERNNFLRLSPAEKGNGGYERQLHAGSLPLDVIIPRVRSGTFRPSLPPPKYVRGFSDEMQSMLAGLLASSRSLAAAKTALARMGLP